MNEIGVSVRELELISGEVGKMRIKVTVLKSELIGKIELLKSLLGKIGCWKKSGHMWILLGGHVV
jgi:hypothetical protein